MKFELIFKQLERSYMKMTECQILVGLKGVESGLTFCQIEKMLKNFMSEWIYLFTLSDIMIFRLIHVQKPPCSFPLSPTFYVCLCLCLWCVHPSMPPLKETYLRIQEQNKREIRNRTSVRLAQLEQAEKDNRQRSNSYEQEEETDSESPTPTLSPAQLPSLSTLSTYRSLCQDLCLWGFIFCLCLLLVRHLQLHFPHEAIQEYTFQRPQIISFSCRCTHRQRPQKRQF